MQALIHALLNAGYEIEEQMPDACRLGRAFGSMMGRTVTVYQSIDSTNLAAKRMAMQGAPHGSVFLAETQTAGRGRLGRQWRARPGEGLWFSVLLKTCDPSALTLLAGLCVAQAIRSEAGIDARIKWPNDVVISGRKLCGILVEGAFSGGVMQSAVMGIGINVDAHAFPPPLEKTASSLFLETGRSISRVPLLFSVLSKLDALWTERATHGTGNILDACRRLCVTLRQPVSVTREGRCVTGVAEDLTASGGLLVRSADGGAFEVVAGEAVIQSYYLQP